jgi:hypothetical protein
MRPQAALGPIAVIGVGGAAVPAGGQPTPPDPTAFYVPLGAFGVVLLILLAAVLSGLRGERRVKRRETLIEQVLVDRDRGQQPDHVVVRSGLEDHDALLEAPSDDRVPVGPA